MSSYKASHVVPLARQHQPALERAPRGRLRTIGLRLVFLLFAVITLDLLVGIVFCRDGRLGQWPLPPYTPVFNDDQGNMLAGGSGTFGGFDPELGWCAYPNGASDAGLVRANSAGIRADREYSPRPAPTVTRIAAFGDSFTFSHGVPNDQAWARLLEDSRPGLEVLNFGYPGYGTDQAYLRYLREGRKFAPQIVLIGLMVENIQRNVSVYRPAYFHSAKNAYVKPRFVIGAGGELQLLPQPARSVEELRDLVESGRLLDRLLETDYWVRRAPLAYVGSPLFRSSIARLLYAAYENGSRQAAVYYKDTNSEPFRVTTRILLEFHTRALADGAEQALVVIFPNRPALEDLLADAPPYWESMLRFLQRKNIPVVDLSGALSEEARRIGLDTLFNEGHYSAAGEAVVAQVLAARFR